jgi:preprotein translocase subunit SecB
VRRGLIHTVEIEKKSFDAARALIAGAELKSIRLMKFGFTTNLPASSNQNPEVSVSSSSRHKGSLNDNGLVIVFDLNLKGHHGENVVIDINASIEAKYDFPKGHEFTPFQIKSFAKSNGMLNIWPYWREYVQAATQRAGLAPLTIPLFRVLHKQSQLKK